MICPTDLNTSSYMLHMFSGGQISSSSHLSDLMANKMPWVTRQDNKLDDEDIKENLTWACLDRPTNLGWVQTLSDTRNSGVKFRNSFIKPVGHSLSGQKILCLLGRLNFTKWMIGF